MMIRINGKRHEFTPNSALTLTAKEIRAMAKAPGDSEVQFVLRPEEVEPGNPVVLTLPVTDMAVVSEGRCFRVIPPGPVRLTK